MGAGPTLDVLVAVLKQPQRSSIFQARRPVGACGTAAATRTSSAGPASKRAKNKRELRGFFLSLLTSEPGLFNLLNLWLNSWMRVLVLMICFVSCVARAESHGGAWLMFFPNIALSDSLSLSSDFQLRQSQALDRTRQTFSRSTLLYAVTPSLKLGGGYAYANTTDYDPAHEAPHSENRVHEQLEYKSSAADVSLVHRVRVEQRFLSNASSTRHRMRYRLAGRLPLSPAVYLSAYNEFFVDYATGDWARFSQNRLYGAVGFPVCEMMRVELGYLWQALHRANRDALNVHAAQVSLFADF